MKGYKKKIKTKTIYTARQPSQAASKAFTTLCRNKKGVISYYVVLREKTQGSANKEYSYLVKRNKLKNL